MYVSVYPVGCLCLIMIMIMIMYGRLGLIAGLWFPIIFLVVSHTLYGQPLPHRLGRVEGYFFVELKKKSHTSVHNNNLGVSQDIWLVAETTVPAPSSHDCQGRCPPNDNGVEPGCCDRALAMN